MFFLLLAALAALNPWRPSAPKGFLFTHVTLIDGNGGPAVENTDLLVRGNTIEAIGPRLAADGAQVIDLEGKTIMPVLISAHTHLGLTRGTTNGAANYTRENILRQLSRYEDYGVGHVLVMGTDRPFLFESGLRDSSRAGLLPGARLHSAGYGFGVEGGVPPPAAGMDRVFRPVSPAQVPAEIDSLVRVGAEVVKIWVDGTPRMSPDVYGAIITEAHRRGLRVAAHVYYLSDARRLVADGLDILAHSVRDSVIDDALIGEMKTRHVTYIPTLSLDKYACAYAGRPEWIDDAFFKASLDTGVYGMITSDAFVQNEVRGSAKNLHALEVALRNVKKVYDAGIPVVLGTDSGAFPYRAQGFSEHLELELLVEAGLTPLEAIGAGTRSAARLLRIDDRYGTLEVGKSADFIVLSRNPVLDIRNTRTILAVYKGGVRK